MWVGVVGREKRRRIIKRRDGMLIGWGDWNKMDLFSIDKKSPFIRRVWVPEEGEGR